MKLKDIKLKNDEKILNILEETLMILIIISAVKKGGFYITDMNIISTLIVLVSFIFFIQKNKIETLKLDITHILLASLPVCYILPLIFGKAIKSDAAIWESIKYVVLFSLYLVITNTKNKKKYEYLIILIGIIIGIFGIDGLADKVFNNILHLLFNSGYLTSYLDRLSSFIQYANTAGILIMVSLLFSIKYLYISIEEVQKDYIPLNEKKFKYLFLISSFLFMCILLTQSRLPILLTIIGIIIIFIINKKSRIINLIINLSVIIFSVLFSNVIMEYVYINKSYIYLIFFIGILLNIIICNLIFSYVVMNIKFWYIVDRIGKNKNKIIVLIISALVILCCIAFTPKDLVISKNSNDLTIEREIKIDNFESIQKINIQVEEIIKNSKYKIEIYEQKIDNNEKLVASFSKESNEEGKFNIILKPETNSKNYIAKFSVQEGKVKIKKFEVNNKTITLSYLLLPSELIFRFKKELFGSVSTNVRIEYIRDAFKIFKTSPIIGRGGETFRYLYKTIQTQHYTSTEVHNSFIQILIESGILGFLCVNLFIIITLINSKFDTNKVIYLLFILHSWFDLNFSYLISVIFFSIISSNLDKEKRKNY